MCMLRTTPTSRERSAKPVLSREWLIAETIKIVREEGLEKATMRRVAQALNTGPASLYVYVRNTAELHAAVTDELTGDLPPDGEGRWDERLEALLGGYRDVLFSHPGLARSALVLRPMGPNTLRLFDRVLGLLLEGGIAAEQAAWGTDLLISHVTGVAAEHAGPNANGEPVDSSAGEEGEIARATRGADPVTLPHVSAHADELLSGTGQLRMSWGLRALIAGIATTPTPTR